MTAGLTDEDRATLAAVADLLIPHGDTMPSASDAHVHTSGIDKVITARPDLEQGVLAALQELGAARPSSFAELWEQHLPHFAALAQAITAGYFLDPDVAQRIGYRKRSAIPISFDNDLNILVADVVARGPIYRPTPADVPSNEEVSAP